jgi:cytochrome c oxidase assembly factor CtaG
MAMSPPPFSWLGGEIHAEVVIGVLLLAALYTYGIVGSRRPIPLRQPLAFFGGCVLTLATAPLWLAGTPGDLLDTILDPVLRSRAGAIVRTATRPLVAFAAYAVVLIGWHLPNAFNAALEAHGWHVVEHVTLLTTALLGWWPVLSTSRRLVVPLVAFTVVFFRWAATEPDEPEALNPQ